MNRTFLSCKALCFAIFLVICTSFLPKQALAENTGESTEGSDKLEARKVQFHLWTDLTFKSSLSNPANHRTHTFDQHHVYLIGEGQMTESIRGYAEVEFEHGGVVENGKNTGGVLKTERAYGEYTFTDFFKIQAGKFLNAYGLWNRFHWEPVTPFVTRPISTENKYIPTNGTGLSILGSIFLSSLEINYTLYVQNGASGEQPDRKDNNNHKAVGGDLFLEWKEMARIGGSIFKDDDNTRDDSNEIALYTVYVAYARFSIWKLRLDLEYLHVPARNKTSYDINEIYIMPGIVLNDMFSVYYRYDNVNRDKNKKNNPHQKHLASVVFNPHSSTRLKLEYYRSVVEDSSTGTKDTQSEEGINFNVSFVY